MKDLLKAISLWILSHRPCKHKWEHHAHITIRGDWNDVVGHKYIYICKKCGKFKIIKT